MAREHRIAAQKQRRLDRAVSSASGVDSADVVRQVYERAFARYQASACLTSQLLSPWLCLQDPRPAESF